jgi:3-methyladenine DNA glycosylase AlkD
MLPKSKTPAYIARHVQRVLKDGGSAPHAEGVQHFFKEEIQSRGWYTHELRKVAVRFRRTIVREAGLPFLVPVADRLFRGRMLEEKVFAVFLLQSEVGRLGDADFRLFESWLGRVSSWADHDALASYLLGPMMAEKPKRASRVFVWARSKNRWYRRAAAVALIRGARAGQFEREIMRIAETLRGDLDDMVQKGLGWLLREWAKFRPERAVPYLMKTRAQLPRLVLRTACETLPPDVKRKILS